MNDAEDITANGNRDVDVYGLLTELSNHILQTHRPLRHDSYFINENDIKLVKRLRAKAYGILLTKLQQPTFGEDPSRNDGIDPVLKILKHAFALKLVRKQTYQASLLERLLEQLLAAPIEETQVLSTLQFLIALKSFKSEPEPITDVFHYGKPNPALPDITCSVNRVSSFQMYPMECFLVSDKFEATLESQRLHSSHGRGLNVRNELCLYSNEINTRNVVGIKSVSTSVVSGFITKHTNARAPQFTTVSPYRYFTSNSNSGPSILSEIKTYKDNDPNENKSQRVLPIDRGLVTSYLYLPYTRTDSGSVSDRTWKSSNNSFHDESDLIDNSYADNSLRVWSRIDVTNVSDASILDRNLRTWESFGKTRYAIEPAFITDLPNVAIHLARIEQATSLFLLSEKLTCNIPLLERVPAKKFIGDLESMLLGVESSSFEYNKKTGFSLRKNISVYGVYPDSLAYICQEANDWGNCFRFLSHLVTPDPQTGKLLQEGLIFKAMCTSIKELLLYYQAALLRVLSSKDKSNGLLSVLGRIRPMAILIKQVTKLCEPYKESNLQCTLGEENGILTRIYNEVIKVTDGKVALVFYSILKSCCEVYFRFLQKWMFEGICDDIYGEFMIKTRPQYLRNRGHKFWTKSFTVSTDAVPGFLTDLTETILQCGKTVRLLRICDSKNPVCNVCITEQPEIRVCLSVTMLREQLMRCKDYEKRCNTVLGPVLSLSLAISEKKRIQKETAELVIRAQRDTFRRIQEERDELTRRIAKTKRDLLISLKEQVANKESQNKREKEDEIRTDRIILEKIGTSSREQDDIRIERTNLTAYYEELSNDTDKRRARSQWRAKRMSYYEKRLRVIAATKILEENYLTLKNKEIASYQSVSDNTLQASYEDENKNLARSESDSVQMVQNTNRNEPSLMNSVYRRNNERSVFQEFLRDHEKLQELASKTLIPSIPATNSSIDNRLKAIERPTVLNFQTFDITMNSSNGKCNFTQKYEMTPNNNEFEINSDFNVNASETANANGNENAKENVNFNENTNEWADAYRDNLETPMSCTTDNFTWSLQSPISQTQHSEEESPSSVRTSVANFKEDSALAELFVSDRRGRVSVAAAVTEQAPLTMADVEIIDHTSLQVYLEKSIRIPLQIQSRLVNNAIIKYFLNQHDLLLHLHSLRSYFFLLNGEFAKSLTDSLYTRLYDISIPIELFNSVTLTNLLERALVNSFSTAYVNSDHLSLSAVDTPLQLHISDPSALDCLSLNYKITWPLNIILDDTVMLQYGKVFKFLITSGRVSWVLQEDFTMMKTERKAATSEQYHKLQLYRHSMMQFMNALHNYLTCSVLHASWAELEKDLQTALTMDQIYLSHVNYIKRILSRCMLNARGEKMRVCIRNIFRVILKFHNRLRSQGWLPKITGHVHPNFKKLEQMYRAFCELRAYMTHVAYKLATSGYQPHLMHFLNALNINDMYDLTVKAYRGASGTAAL